MNRILITGSNGQLGREFCFLQNKHPEMLFYFQSKEELDISDVYKLESYVKSNKINVIVNCAAYTNVEGAERNKEIAFFVNSECVTRVAKVAKKQKVKLIHISTDYVFDGEKGEAYYETDTVNPLNIYGESKLLGEKNIENISPENSIIIRTSWLFSSFGNNFVKTMLRLGENNANIDVVNDQVGCPTYARDLAEAIILLIPSINNINVEKYHYSSLGEASWFEFAKEIILSNDYNCIVNPVPSVEYKQIAKRPKKSVLNTKKIQNILGVEPRSWKNALMECVNELKI
jgi:dTDP-4-dehydrorhamnose reductase